MSVTKFAENTTHSRLWGITHQLKDNDVVSTDEVEQGKYTIGERRALTKLGCWMGRGVEAMSGAARRNPVKTVAIMALLALAGIAIAKAMGHGTPFDAVKGLVLDHKLESALIGGGLGFGLLNYGRGRYIQNSEAFLTELKGYLPSFGKKQEQNNDEAEQID